MGLDPLKKAGRTIDRKTERMLALFAVLSAMLSGSMSGADRAQVGGDGIVETVITVVVVGIVGIIGILIFSEVDDNINVTGDLASSQTNLSDGFGDAMELLPVVLIVLVAALVILAIGIMRRR